MHKIFYLISWASILSALLTILVAGVWMVYPYKTLTVDDSPEWVDKEIYKPGDTMTFHIDYCKYTDVKPLVTRQFVDGVIYTVPSYISASNDIGCGNRDIQVIIPTTLPDGEYKLTTTHRYQMNPLRVIDVMAETVKFKIQK